MAIETTPYPYTRSEECSWQPEDVARHLSALLSQVGGHVASKTDVSNSSTQLLSHGWSSRQVPTLRLNYGSNQLSGDAAAYPSHSSCLVCIKPVAEALFSQFKEPLILMLLGSAGLSVLLGNKADAISIAIALLIVGMVAAVQEYRSEQALEKLANLVPHTCTVLRDGQVLDRFFARELVVGDLVLLSTGE